MQVSTRRSVLENTRAFTVKNLSSCVVHQPYETYILKKKYKGKNKGK